MTRTHGPFGRSATEAHLPAMSVPLTFVDDQTLARGLAAGDREAFRLLVERESRFVFRICYRIVGRVDESDDLTQETFMLAYRALETFRGGSHRAWLARIATRECYRHVAGRRRAQARSVPLDDRVIDHTADPVDHVTDIIAAERHAQVRDAVGALPEPYREVVTMRYFGELSLAEIAAASGRPLGTIKAQLYRGLDRLRDRLGDGST
jgi:RNA polymerase sigma-70 factor (ECF subfamily)